MIVQLYLIPATPALSSEWNPFKDKEMGWLMGPCSRGFSLKLGRAPAGEMLKLAAHMKEIDLSTAAFLSKVLPK